MGPKGMIRSALVSRAKSRSMMTYTEVARLVGVEPHDPRLSSWLGEISREEDAAGRGMLSAIVVHKAGDMEPGWGFFEFAAGLGRDVHDTTAFWVEEVKRVYRAWSR
jgi:hypothetical protein